MNIAQQHSTARSESSVRWVSPRIAVCVALLLGMGLVWEEASQVGHAAQLIEPLEIAPQVRPAVETLLMDLWQPGQQTRQAARDQFEATQPMDRAVTLAFTAHRLNDFSRSDFDAPISELLEQDPDFIDGWLIKAHFGLIRREFSQSLLDLRTLGRLLARKDLPDDQLELLFYQVGRMLGYLQGPAFSPANRDLIGSVMAQFRQLGQENQIQALESGVRDILINFGENLDQANEILTQELEQAARTDEVQEQRLNQENQNLQFRIAQLGQQLGEVANRFAAEEAQLAGQLPPLQSNLFSLESQVSTLQWQLNRLYGDLFFAQSDPYFPLFALNGIFNQIRATEFSLASARQSYQLALGQVSQLQAQLQQLQAIRNNETTALQREVRQATRRLDNNQKELARIAAGPEVPLGRRRVVEVRTNAIRNYIPYSHELLRQELLEALGRR